MGPNLFKGTGNRRVNSVLRTDMFRKLRKPFKGNRTHIKKESFILEKILCCPLHHVILYKTWLFERMHHRDAVSLE